jgi:purine-nucleoside phosphorylase
MISPILYPFVGAEVLVYESGRGVSSISIRTSDLYPEMESERREGRRL